MLSPAQNREIGARYVPTPSNLFKCAFRVHLGAILVAVMPFCAMGKPPIFKKNQRKRHPEAKKRHIMLFFVLKRAKCAKMRVSRKNRVFLAQKLHKNIQNP